MSPKPVDEVHILVALLLVEGVLLKQGEAEQAVEHIVVVEHLGILYEEVEDTST
jgi:hypothetical protein